jgi:hypothetical protein
LAFVLIGMFPPWVVRTVYPDMTRVERNAGYHLLTFPPVPDPNQRFAFRASVQIDWSRLKLEWLILAGGIGVALAWQFTRARGSYGQPNGAERSNEPGTCKPTEDGALSPPKQREFKQFQQQGLAGPIPNENPPIPSKSGPINPLERRYPKLSKEQREKMLDEVVQHLKEKKEHEEKKKTANERPADEPATDGRTGDAAEQRYPKLSQEQKERVLKEVKESQEVEKLLMKKTSSTIN